MRPDIKKVISQNFKKYDLLSFVKNKYVKTFYKTFYIDSA